MNKTLCLLVSLSLFHLACPSPVEGPSSDTGSSSSADAGAADTVRVDGSSSGSDAGMHDQGHSMHDASGGGSDAMAMDFGGFDISGFDAGVMEYDGGSEPGVICGDTTCPEGDQCCAGLLGTSCASVDAACSMLSVAVPCDGNEDCTGTQECCVLGSSFSDYQIVCVDQGNCSTQGGTAVCINSAECGSTQACCSASALQNGGLELGWCVDDGC